MVDIELSAEARDPLRVDAFLADFLHARALKSALELGLIEALHGAPDHALALDEWSRAHGADEAGLRFLGQLLHAAGVLDQHGPRVALTPAFRAAWRWRDLLEAKLDFCGIVLADLAQHGSDWLAAPQRFQRQARTFALFDYGRCFPPFTPENEARTRAWMRLTSALSRAEAAACAEAFDFRPHHHLLDVGGNSGEFAAAMCARHPQVQATVLDLPLVCRIGRTHLQGRSEAARVQFSEGNVRRDDLPWPAGADLISFKSMLHDWPEADARRFLQRAFDTLPPGGGVLVIERSPLPSPAAGAMPPFASLPLLVFFRHYRPADFYLQAMQQAGFIEPRVARFTLDQPFHAVSARKPA
jgi:ubiquinone/menaquinone biosynthesis C-methylase UbiE